jgi:hypothetical protein
MLAWSFSGFDPGCVKTRLREGCAELFSQLPYSERSCQHNPFHIDEIEMEVLHASWTSDFSHSLDPKRTLSLVNIETGGARFLARRTFEKC